MLFRTFSAALVGCTLPLAPLVAIAASRVPSTPEDRKQALEFIHYWQTDPLGPHAKDHFAWVLKWFADVPDLTVHVCTVFDELPKGDEEDANTNFAAEFMSQAPMCLRTP
jgi:hypothetical protein